MGQTSSGHQGDHELNREGTVKIICNCSIKKLGLTIINNYIIIILDVALVFPLTNVGREHCFELSDFTTFQYSLHVGMGMYAIEKVSFCKPLFCHNPASKMFELFMIFSSSLMVSHPEVKIPHPDQLILQPR